VQRCLITNARGRPIRIHPIDRSEVVAKGRVSGTLTLPRLRVISSLDVQSEVLTHLDGRHTGTGPEEMLDTFPNLVAERTDRTVLP